MKTVFTDLFLKSLNKVGRYTDGDIKGLNLQVKPNLQKYWALRYSYQGARYDHSLGAYPEISLKEARRRATSARNLLNQGINPTTERKAQKELIAKKEQVKQKFKEYALACIETKRPEWSNEKHAEQWEIRCVTMPTNI